MITVMSDDDDHFDSQQQLKWHTTKPDIDPKWGQIKPRAARIAPEPILAKY